VSGRASLPIDPLLPSIVETLKAGKDLVLTAEPGAGKTTRVPAALLEAGLLDGGECWVLEPRRLAARLAAARVAEELGEDLGGRVGYAVRFEQKVSRETRIRFVTEGLLLRRLQEDPRLAGIAVVVLDEFHERHVHTDLALTLLRRLQGLDRPDLRLLVMSATLDAGPVCGFLEAAHLHGEGRVHPVELRTAPRPDDRPLSARVDEALGRLLGEGRKGHILVFLPGAAEIRQCLAACAGTAGRSGLELLPLHGSLPFEAQKQAVAPSDRAKAIFATNVAESSVTIEGVTAVIDSGLGREAVHSAWSGLSGLRTVRISQARCIQRAGRAGRTAPGVCLRLFTEAEFQARPAFDEPELLRTDLAEALLALHALGIGDPGSLGWFEAPPPAALAAAERLLQRLGALDGAGRLTATGRRMAALPLHPRLARLVAAGEERGIPGLARLAAALLEAGDLSARSGLDRRSPETGHALDSDLWVRLDAYREAEAAGFAPGACRAAGLDPAAVRQAHLAFKALGGRKEGAEPADAEERLRMALLAAYPDRVARAGGAGTFALTGGGGARLDAASRVRQAELILALEAEETARGTGREVLIRTASRIEPEWLLEAFPEAIRDTESLVFNPAQGRVERISGLWYEDLCLDETRRGADPADPATAACLAQAALERGLGDAQETVDRLLARVRFLAGQRPELGLPEGEALRTGLLRKAAEGCRSLKELAACDWTWPLKELLGPDASRLLEAWAPEAVQLPRRRARVNYGEAPWIASRLQDFLGMKEGPRIAGGSVPLVLHLLAPNGRAVQVTTDLAGFWQRAYRELRPQLSRRYPKHAWPEDPA
jgi:ATP-dependent helicase HrpB